MSGGGEDGRAGAQPDPGADRGPGWRDAKRGPRAPEEPSAPPTAAEAAAAHPGRGLIRLGLLGVALVAGMGAIGARFADLAGRGADMPARAPNIEQEAELTPRLTIVDRNGAPLVSNLRTYRIGYDSRVASPPSARRDDAAELARLFPEWRADQLHANFIANPITTVRRSATPREAQAAHDLGLPGLYRRDRFDRVYHLGPAAAHVLGFVNDKGGVAGVEGALEAKIAAGAEAPLALSIDARAQLAAHEALARGMRRTGAVAGSALVMDARTGEVAAMVSLPAFDPAELPPRPGPGARANPYRNHALTPRELGSVLKTVTWALALETGETTLDEVFPPSRPVEVDGFKIGEKERYDALTLAEAYAKSSNVVSATLALRVGAAAQQRMLKRLGLHAALEIELTEARGATPRWGAPWTDARTVTASYGHGVTVTPAHVAAATASLINGGWRVRPTLLKRPPEAALERGERVVGPGVSSAMRDMLRLAVAQGTGRSADAPGLEIGGKTGTADLAQGGAYAEDKVIASFVGAFPMSAPAYVAIVTLEEPEVEIDGQPRRSAAYTAAPVFAEIASAAAPLLGVAPAAPAALTRRADAAAPAR
ncbi:MAG: penicillin-binding protein 2 [Pseudomonadota bacterium]